MAQGFTVCPQAVGEAVGHCSPRILRVIEQLVHAPICAPWELPASIDDWPEDWREEYEERAAIMEYDGGLQREQAEQWAETIVRAAYHLHTKTER